ncbi:MAG: hypothetical protein QM817_06370 [Archangium sp.]
MHALLLIAVLAAPDAGTCLPSCIEKNGEKVCMPTCAAPPKELQPQRYPLIIQVSGTDPALIPEFLALFKKYRVEDLGEDRFVGVPSLNANQRCYLLPGITGAKRTELLATLRVLAKKQGNVQVLENALSGP